MEAFQERMIEEHKELEDRVLKLDKFIHGNEKFKTLDIEEQKDMKRQFMGMLAYLTALERRMKRQGLLEEKQGDA